MSAQQLDDLDPRVQAAIEELHGTIVERYPNATFEVARDQDEPENVDLITTVDLDDPDEVLDLVIDRLVGLQVEDRIPVHVIPIRTPERILAAMRAEPRAQRPLEKTLSRPEGSKKSIS